jgi:hypothetical protein
MFLVGRDEGTKAMIEAIPTGVVMTAGRESSSTIFFFAAGSRVGAQVVGSFAQKQRRLEDKSTATAGLVSN